MENSKDHEDEPTSASYPVDVARRTIWRLFEEGQVDERSATDALLAVDLGLRRMRYPQGDADKREHGDGVDPGK